MFKTSSYVLNDHLGITRTLSGVTPLNELDLVSYSSNSFI